MLASDDRLPDDVPSALICNDTICPLSLARTSHPKKVTINNRSGADLNTQHTSMGLKGLLALLIVLL